MDDACCVFTLLGECVAARLRGHGLRAGNISISVRDTDLLSASCQRGFRYPTNLSSEITQTGLALFRERFASGFPYRSLGLSCGQLHPEGEPLQMDLWGAQLRRERAERAERAVDGLRRRYGHQIILRGTVLADRNFARINPREKHTVHPVPYFAG